MISHSDTFSYSLSRKRSSSLSHALFLTLTHTLPHSDTNSSSLSHTLFLTLTHTLPHSRTRSLSLTHVSARPKVPLLNTQSLDESEIQAKIPRSKPSPRSASTPFPINSNITTNNTNTINPTHTGTAIANGEGNLIRKSSYHVLTSQKTDSTDDVSLSSVVSGEGVTEDTNGQPALTPAHRNSIANRSKEALQRHQVCSVVRSQCLRLPHPLINFHFFFHFLPLLQILSGTVL